MKSLRPPPSSSLRAHVRGPLFGRKAHELVARMDMESRGLHSVIGSETVQRIAKLIDTRLVGEVDLQLAARAEKILGFNNGAARLIARTRSILAKSAKLKER
jgi:hypothetical protein